MRFVKFFFYCLPQVPCFGVISISNIFLTTQYYSYIYTYILASSFETILNKQQGGVDRFEFYRLDFIDTTGCSRIIDRFRVEISRCYDENIHQLFRHDCGVDWIDIFV
jgi:hypothetical protein